MIPLLNLVVFLYLNRLVIDNLKKFITNITQSILIETLIF